MDTFARTSRADRDSNMKPEVEQEVTTDRFVMAGVGKEACSCTVRAGTQCVLHTHTFQPNEAVSDLVLCETTRIRFRRV